MSHPIPTTTQNRALWRTLRALSHPTTLGAVIVLLLNDHLLRIAWPSWWTGKLGDFSWLVFFPFVLAAPLALVIPSRVRRHEAIVAGLAFGLTGLMFASMKTIPAAMSAGLWVLRHITGGPFILRVDPTDLLALPGLLIGWWVWREAAKPAPASRGWAILALGALATIANMAPAHPGVRVVTYDGDGVISAYSGSHYVSSDGGFTWEDAGEYSWDDLPRAAVERTSEETWQLADPSNEKVLYRFVPGIMIERSDDGGQTWTQDIDLRWSDAQKAYFFKLRHDGNALGPGPMDAVIDEVHGTVVVAMGSEGVLTRTSDGEWRWVAMGDPANTYTYLSRRSDLRNIPNVASLLLYEFVLAVDVYLLVVGSSWFLALPGRVSFWITLNGILAILSWGLIMVIGPANMPLYYRQLMSPVIVVMLLFGIGFARSAPSDFYANFFREGQDFPAINRRAALLAAGLFIVPYISWSQGVIPEYWQAQLFAVAAAVACAVITARHLSQSGFEPRSADC